MAENTKTLSQAQALTLLIEYVDSLVSNPERQAIAGIVAKHIKEYGDNEISIEAFKQKMATEIDAMFNDREVVTGLSGYTIPAQPTWERGGLVGCSVNAALRRLDGTLEAGTVTRKAIAKIVKAKQESELLPKVASSANVSKVA